MESIISSAETCLWLRSLLQTPAIEHKCFMSRKQ